MKSDPWELFHATNLGDNIQEVVETEDCKVLRMDTQNGDGVMTMYRVFDGVYLMYNDFHMKSCYSQFTSHASILCLDHCREGRIEHKTPKGQLYYIEAGDLRIVRRVHHTGTMDFPLCHYHGITIGFFMSTAVKSIQEAMPGIKIDLEEGILTTIFIVLMICLFDIRVGIIAMAGVLLFFLINSFLQKRGKQMAPIKDASDRKLVETVLEYIQGISEVKAYNLTGEKSKDLNLPIDENSAANTKMEFL